MFTLFIVGSLDAFWGLPAIFEHKNVIIGGNGVIIAMPRPGPRCIRSWVPLVALTGSGPSRARDGAFGRDLFVSLNAIAQIVWFLAAPLWRS